MMRTVIEAKHYAEGLHARDVDAAGAPYVYHLRRVAALVASDEAAMVAYLHDAIEMHDARLSGLVDERILRAVELLTREPGATTYREYIRRIAHSGDVLALEVKIADLLDHLRYGAPPSLVPRYLQALGVLLEAR